MKKNSIQLNSYKSLKYILRTSSTQSKLYLLLAIIISIASAFIDFSLLTSLYPFLKELTETSQHNNYIDLNHFTIIKLALTSILTRVFSTFLCFFSINRIGLDLTSYAFKKSISLSLSSHIDYGTALIQTSLTTHMERSIVHILGAFINAIVGLLTSIILVCAIFISTGTEGLLFLFCLSILYLFVYISTRKSFNKSGKIVREATEKLEFIIAESIGNFRETLSEINQDIILREYKYQAKKARDNTAIVNSIRLIPRNVIEGGLIIILVIGVISSRLNEAIIPSLGVIALAAQRLIPYIQNIFTFITSLSVYKYGLNQIIKIIESEKDSTFNYNKKDNIEKRNYINIKNIRISNLVIINNDKTIIKDFNYEFNKGLSYCITGKSGTGKSTLLDIIIGLSKPDKGNIKINDFNMSYDPSFIIKYRNSLSYVPQKHIPSPTIVKDFIIYGQQYSDRKLNDVSELTFCKKLLNEKCNKLSGGEMQRVSLARAILTMPSLFIMDESTNALDIELEEKIIKNIIKYLNKSIILSVSHRPETFKIYDKIIKIEK